MFPQIDDEKIKGANFSDGSDDQLMESLENPKMMILFSHILEPKFLWRCTLAAFKGKQTKQKMCQKVDCISIRRTFFSFQGG